MGSFVSASAKSWPEWRQVLQARSRCGHCETKLTIIDLVPVFSYLMLRGQCRTCKAPIGRVHFIVELLAITIAISAVWAFDGWMELATALLGWTLLFASLVDFRLRLLPNGSSFALILAGGIMAFTHGQWDELGMSVLGASIGYVVFFGISKLYLALRGREGLGRGDAKLLAAGGAWTGPFALSWIVLIASLLALLGLVANRKKGEALKADTALAFGPALAASIYLVWLGTNLPALMGRG